MSEAHAGPTGPDVYTSDRTSTRSTGWVGWVWFAAIMMIMTGVFSVMYGLVALFKDTYYTVSSQGLLMFDLTKWGWIFLIVGTLAMIAGIALFSGAMWARITAVLLASINLIAQLAFMSAYPVWAMIAIALDIIVIWAAIVHGDDMTSDVWD